jgi:hypothetical protein
MSGAVRLLERTSRAAVVASVFLLVALQLSVHTDLTPVLLGLSLAAFVTGWLTGRRSATASIGVWLFLAPLAPATLRALTGREGTVLDLVWMSGLAGSLLRATPWSTWSLGLPPTWRVLLGGWALTVALGWPVIVAREVVFDWNGFSDVGAINSWAKLSAPQAASWIQSVALTQLLAILWFDWLTEWRRAKAGEMPLAAHGLWLGVTTAGLVAMYQGTVDMSFANLPTWAVLQRATGTMLDANAYGMAAALAGPASFLWLRARPFQGSQPAAFAVLLLNELGVWMSGSRTALLCGTVGLLALAAGLRTSAPPTSAPRAADQGTSGHGTSPQRTFGQQTFGQHLFGQRAAGLLMALAGVGAAAAVLLFATSASGPLERLRTIPASAAGFDWLWNRLGYGTAALQMLREFPLTGVGIGAYHLLVPDYSRMVTGVMLPFDNAQNWWRHQSAELGLLGALPILVWSAILAVKVVRVRAWGGERPAAWTSHGLLLGLGLASLLGVPTQNPVVLLWFFLLVSWSMSPSTYLAPGEQASGARARLARPDEGRTHEPTHGWLPMVALGCLAVAASCAVGHLVLARDGLSVAARAVRAERDYVAGAYAPEPYPGGGEFRWTTARARFIWRAETPVLAVHLWAGHPDIAQAPVRVRLLTPCQVLLDESLSTTGVRLGLELPDGLRMVDTTVQVSRTWQPSAFGAADTRRLGVGIASEFVDDGAPLSDQAKTIKIQACS